MREVIETMHKKKVDSSPALVAIYNNLKKSCPPEITMNEFCKWTAANPTVVSPLLILQLKLRKQIIGERYWSKMAAERKANSEQGLYYFVKYISHFTHIILQGTMGSLSSCRRS